MDINYRFRKFQIGKMNNSKYKRQKSPNRKKGIVKSKKKRDKKVLIEKECKGINRNRRGKITKRGTKREGKLVKLPCHTRPPSFDICHTSFIPIITNEST